MNDRPMPTSINAPTMMSAGENPASWRVSGGAGAGAGEIPDLPLQVGEAAADGAEKYVEAAQLLALESGTFVALERYRQESHQFSDVPRGIGWRFSAVGVNAFLCSEVYVDVDAVSLFLIYDKKYMVSLLKSI